MTTPNGTGTEPEPLKLPDPEEVLLVALGSAAIGVAGLLGPRFARWLGAKLRSPAPVQQAYDAINEDLANL